MPTPGRQDARDVIHATFIRLGIDIDNEEQIQSLKDTIQWVKEQRDEREKREAFRQAFGLSAIAALLGAIATTIGEWAMRHSGGSQ